MQKNYRYLQFGLISIFVTLPVQLTAFSPGKSTGKSPLMALFMEVASLYASISGVLSVMFPDIPSSSVMDMPTMRVIAPVP